MTYTMQGTPEQERAGAYRIANRFAQDADFCGNSDMRKDSTAIASGISGGLNMSEMHIVAIGGKKLHGRQDRKEQNP